MSSPFGFAGGGVKMPIGFICSSCSKGIRVSRRHAGKKGRCPRCRAAVQVPAASDDEDENSEEAEVALPPGKASRDDWNRAYLDAAIGRGLITQEQATWAVMTYKDLRHNPEFERLTVLALFVHYGLLDASRALSVHEEVARRLAAGA